MTKNLTPYTNPLGTRRCFVHPWRCVGGGGSSFHALARGSGILGSHPLITHTLGGWAGPLSRGTISHPWSWRALLLGGRLPTLGRPPHSPWARGFVCRRLRHFLCPIFGRGSHPSPALWQALVHWAVNQAKQRGRGRLRWLPWVLGGPGGRNGIAHGNIARITASLYVGAWC